MQVFALQQAVPGFEPNAAYDGAPPGVEAAPGFHGCHALQVLVRPHVVVPGDELDQRGVEAGAVRHDPAVELLLQRAEETLDATILPRAVALDGLVFDAELVEYEFEQRAIEDGLVVGIRGRRELNDRFACLMPSRNALAVPVP